MKTEIITQNQTKVAVINSEEPLITDVSSASLAVDKLSGRAKDKAF